MNITSIVKGVVCAAAGFVVGVIFGSAATKAAIEPKIKQEVKKGIDAYVGAHSSKSDPDNSADDQNVIIMRNPKPKSTVAVVEMSQHEDAIVEDKHDSETAQEMIKGKYIFEDKEAPEINTNGPTPLLAGPFRAGSVRIISEEEYDNSKDYTRSSIAYYTVDQQFFDETDEPVRDDEIYGLVGTNILNCFGFCSSDPDIVYVYNANRNLNIEVARIRGRHDDEFD